MDNLAMVFLAAGAALLGLGIFGFRRKRSTHANG
jgi:LPXTG-motif cell wall-anchored protein